MADPFIAEIKIFGGNFPPRYWAFCEGQLLPIAQNTALFSLLGTTYGGDGRTTFGLPDLRGRAPMHPGQGPGLTNRTLGEQGGAETVTLLTSQIPAHNHSVPATTEPAKSETPTSNLPASPAEDFYQASGAKTLVPMNANSTSPAGGGQPHNNLQPYLSMNFIIALAGVYPLRS